MPYTRESIIDYTDYLKQEFNASAKGDKSIIETININFKKGEELKID